MEQAGRARIGYLLYVIVAAAAVYCIANKDVLTNPYLINDDVRQQIYWMQQWHDPELFQGDLLTDYARNYVPWGVKLIYRCASLFMDPVRFTNLLTGFLFVLAAGFLFGLALEFHDDLTAVLVVCVFFLFAGFLGKMAGGLSRTFVVPLLFAYLFCIARNSTFWAGCVLLLQACFNTYIFLLCLVTHALYIAHHHGKDIVLSLLRDLTGKSADPPAPDAFSLSRFLTCQIPVGLGILVNAVGFLWFSSRSFGTLVTRADMAGRVEYTALGRYEVLPQPSFVSELIRPWIFNLPFREWGFVAGWLGVTLVVALVLFALRHWRPVFSWNGFRVFLHLVPASLLLYGIACLVLMKLFVPRRYLEYTLNLLYCMGTAVFLRVAIEQMPWRRYAFPWLTTLLVLFAAVRLHNVELYDYSKDADLYRFLRTTPKTCLIAGHPEVMDNIPTFAGRKAFVTYELSHTWIQPYWNEIKKRTYDLFRAYYAADPAAVRAFCSTYGITYLIVREEDFSREKLMEGGIYFEPFDELIRSRFGTQSAFAVLDASTFPPLYEKNGLRLLKIDPGGPSIGVNITDPGEQGIGAGFILNAGDSSRRPRR